MLGRLPNFTTAIHNVDRNRWKMPRPVFLVGQYLRDFGEDCPFIMPWQARFHHVPSFL